MYRKGATLKLDFGTYFHYGIADGMGGVVHNSKKHLMVTQECEEDFAEEREILVSSITSNNPIRALEKAKSYIGMPYNLIQSNCEHFVRLCHGLEIESTQIQKYLLVGVTAGIAANNTNPIIKIASAAASIAALITPREENPLKNAALAALITGAVVFVVS